MLEKARRYLEDKIKSRNMTYQLNGLQKVKVNASINIIILLALSLIIALDANILKEDSK